MIKNIFKNKNKKMSEEMEIYEGVLNEKDKISPTYINLKNPKQIEIDEKFFVGIIIFNYNREYENIILKDLINSNLNINISMFYEKKDTNRVLKELTYHIGTSNLEIKEKSQNSTDIDLAISSNNDAKYIRKQLQVENEELFFLYIYITIFSDREEDLEMQINKLENILASSGLQYKKAIFRQEQLFLSTLPIMQNNEDVKNVAKRNILTTGLISTYPFIISNIFDEEGIFLGENRINNSLIFLDRYNMEKYKNANICVFGTSRCWKIFFFKIINIKKPIIWNRAIYYRSRERIYKNL